MNELISVLDLAPRFRMLPTIPDGLISRVRF